MVKTDFSYELLSRFLDGVLDGSFLGKLDLVDGFFAIKIKPSQRRYLGFSLVNEFGVLELYEFWVLPQARYHHSPVYILSIYISDRYHHVFMPYDDVCFIYHLLG